jgi:hypothetical protein
MGIKIITRWCVKTAHLADIDAFTNDGYVYLQQGIQEICVRKGEIPDVIEALRLAGDACTESEEIPF